MGRSCVLVACITSSSTALLGLGSPSKQALYGLRVLEVKEYGRTRRTSAEILDVFQMRTTRLCRAVWLLKPCVSLSTDGIISCFSWNRNKGGHTAPFDLLCYLQFVPGPYGALLEHLYEYALPGHDAVPCRLAYGAVIMALLAYLGNLAYGIWA